jgi:hypothetical protein
VQKEERFCYCLYNSINYWCFVVATNIEESERQSVSKQQKTERVSRRRRRRRRRKATKD